MEIVKFRSKYLKFELVGDDGEFKDYRVWNKKEEHLGFINYHPKWKRYVFTSPLGETIYDVSCLNDIIRFINEIPC